VGELWCECCRINIKFCMRGLILLIFMLFVGLGVQAQSLSEREPSGRFEPAKAVHIFPNPAVDFVHVKIDHFSAEHVKLTVHNIIGNEVPVEVEVLDKHELRVRVKDLNSGYYLLALKDDENRFQGTYKFLKR